VVLNLKDREWETVATLGTQDQQLLGRQEVAPEEERSLSQLLEQEFTAMGEGLGRTNLVEHRIITESAPIKQRYYPVSPPVLKQIHTELDEMIAEGVVEPSASPWSSPILLVKKKTDHIGFALTSGS